MIRDKDGGVTEYRGTVSVGVTFDSLCALVRSFARRHARTRTRCCAKLADAAQAPTDGAKAGKLSAFRNQVDAKTGPEPGQVVHQRPGSAAEGCCRRACSYFANSIARDSRITVTLI